MEIIKIPIKNRENLRQPIQLDLEKVKGLHNDFDVIEIIYDDLETLKNTLDMTDKYAIVYVEPKKDKNMLINKYKFIDTDNDAKQFKKPEKDIFKHKGELEKMLQEIKQKQEK